MSAQRVLHADRILLAVANSGSIIDFVMALKLLLTALTRLFGAECWYCPVCSRLCLSKNKRRWPSFRWDMVNSSRCIHLALSVDWLNIVFFVDNQRRSGLNIFLDWRSFAGFVCLEVSRWRYGARCVTAALHDAS